MCKIFSDLATPNNHPVNTLLIKLFWFGRESFWSIRVGSLLFSLGSVYLLYMLGRKLFNRHAAWYAAIAGAFLPPLIISGTTARGYSGEIFFLLLFSFSLLNCRKGSVKWSIAAAVSGSLAIISLPTAILYIAPVSVAFLLYLWKKKRVFPLQTTISSISALLAVFWYILNWNSFIQQKQFKAVIGNSGDFYNWITSSLAENGIELWIVFFILLSCRKRKIIRILTAIIFFPLISALITSPAPARVYLPSAAAGILLCASFATITTKWRYPVISVLLILQIAVSFPHRTEEYITGEIMNFKEPTAIKIFPPAAGYVLRWNHPETVKNFFTSLQSAAAKKTILLLVPEKEQITGFAVNGSIHSLPLPFPLDSANNNETAPYRLLLKKTPVIPANTLAFAIYPPMPQENLAALYQNLAPGTTLVFNQWLRVPLTAPDGKIHKYMIFAFTIDKERIFPAGYPVYIPLEK